MSDTSASPTVEELAVEAVGGAPSLGPDGARIAVALYRLLALGAPVSTGSLASTVGIDEAEVGASLEAWPAVFRDDQGCVIAFWGLALPDMGHRLDIGGQTLFAWCAFDTLFLPKVLDAVVGVESADPQSGVPVRLVVGPEGVRSAEPAEAVLTFARLTEAGGFDDDVISNFCHHILFFDSAESAAGWKGDRTDVVVLSLDEGVDLARLWVEGLFGESA